MNSEYKYGWVAKCDGWLSWATFSSTRDRKIFLDGVCYTSDLVGDNVYITQALYPEDLEDIIDLEEDLEEPEQFLNMKKELGF